MQPKPDNPTDIHWPNSIDAVALDMDGLMLNTEELYNEVIEKIVHRRQKPFRPEVRRQMMGQPAAKAWEVLIESESLSVSWRELQQEADDLFVDLLPQRVAPMPGLLDFLDFLDRHSIPRCVATSSLRSFAHRALSLARVLDRLDFIVTAEDVERGKPSPDIYWLAAKNFGIEPHSMLVFEDSGHGCKAGVAAGACVVAVPGEHSRDHSFDGAFAIAQSLGDPLIYRIPFSKTGSQP